MLRFARKIIPGIIRSYGARAKSSALTLSSAFPAFTLDRKRVPNIHLPAAAATTIITLLLLRLILLLLLLLLLLSLPPHAPAAVLTTCIC